MAKLGSRKRPAVLRVQTEERARDVLALCQEQGWQAIVGVEPDQPERLDDLRRLISRDSLDGVGSMEPFYSRYPEVADRETRVIIVNGDDLPLPADGYALDELYCADPACDCRRVMLKVYAESSGAHLATINHAFDVPDDDEPQTFLDPLNPQSACADDLLDLVEGVNLRDADYVARLERHYRMFKESVASDATPERSRLTAPRLVAARALRRKKQRASATERVFIFDRDAHTCVGEIERERWERAITRAGGAVAVAAVQCRLEGVPSGAKALRGRSVEEALATYRRR
jgi:hypothetical protein